MFFGKNIKYLRKLKGLNQAEMHDSIGIARATWSNYELNQTEPPFSVLLNISKFFGINIHDIINTDLELAALEGDLINKTEITKKRKKGDLNSDPKGDLKGSIEYNFEDEPTTVVMEDEVKYEANIKKPTNDITEVLKTAIQGLQAANAQQLRYIAMLEAENANLKREIPQISNQMEDQQSKSA